MRRSRTILRTLGVALLVAGAVLAAAALLMPQAVEKAYGEARTAVIQQVDQVRQDVFSELPSVALGARGGIPELDRCDGTFTEMLSYEREDVPPVWAAHNNCAGDVILGWGGGQQVRIDGRDEIYEVTDIRYTSKIWSSTDDLVGLGGELALQTCFYGEDRMKFVALTEVSG
ncbi:hypothetical protein [Microbacterium sp. JZ31]|uniref:hypothetical protein n=1 Tax=Microbacterium sp. JZ31 TaxID=1906274 RepID=UPI001932F9D9|nr:hypothetical protein [Microbacterium sp. JZ31]